MACYLRSVDLSGLFRETEPIRGVCVCLEMYPMGLAHGVMEPGRSEIGRVGRQLAAGAGPAGRVARWLNVVLSIPLKYQMASLERTEHQPAAGLCP